jgi:hypothetical protein
MDRAQKLLVITMAVVVVAVVSLQFEGMPSSIFMLRRHIDGIGGPSIIGDLEIFYTVKMVLSSINVVLLGSLLVIYYGIYRDLKSEFSLSLLFFCLALLLYAVTSNPLVSRGLGFIGYGLGPFAMLPDVFTLIASAVLLYLVTK